MRAPLVDLEAPPNVAKLSTAVRPSTTKGINFDLTVIARSFADDL
jgi:hypothetical protein